MRLFFGLMRATYPVDDAIIKSVSSCNGRHAGTFAGVVNLISFESSPSKNIKSASRTSSSLLVIDFVIARSPIGPTAAKDWPN